jgi:hypothetical protein
MNIVPPWLDTFLLVWFILTGLSVLYVAWDAFTKNPELKVMKWGWILVTAYTGPIGAALYVLSCKEPKKVCTRNLLPRYGSSRLARLFTAWLGMLRG